MKPIASLCLAFAMLTGLAACGEEATPTTRPSDGATSAPATSTPESSAHAEPPSSERPAEPAGPVVEVAIKGDEVTPAGKRISAQAGVPVTFVITSDRAGGLHVHSSPEQTPEFVDGTTTLQVTIERPGLIDVEEHESGELVVQLEVR
ncbi:hypothetical protein SAMN05428985_10216 [Nocardioides sp. YR527]|uniref:hypothetical protein n=1 Tax=Nocardioides sp. YR527 TaxID=1881028 RepID=UPI000880FFF0|nr:hypothetical protein [Nocardioides sp. YR527]SDJ95935.1 hypothetical protein SAMN05428985_10216 [Nocardioides sp. YR527]